MSTLCEKAVEYLNRGFSIHPVGRDKQPLLSTWKEYQTRKPTEEEVKKWFTSYPDANIAIITGAISGIVVVDVEEEGSTERLTPTVMSATGGHGFHFYYKHPGFFIRNSVEKLGDKIDFRGDGGYVLAPPSVSYKGSYKWEVDFDTADPVELPEWILKFYKEGKKEKVDWQEFTKGTNNVGNRNSSATQFVGKLLHDLSPELWESSAWPALQSWNQKNNLPPLSDNELKAIFESIATAETNSRLQKIETGGEEEKQSEVMIKHAKPLLRLFKDEMGDAYAVVKNVDHDEVWPVNGRNKNFRLWLVKVGREKLKKVPSEIAIKETISSLEADAIFDGETIPLYNRVAPGEDGSIWIDMTDAKWRAIHISKDKWQIVDNPPVLFKRYQHQLPMVEPERDGEIDLLNEFLNVIDTEHIVLLYTFLVASLVPDISVACLILHGVQGSSKTTVFKILRSLVDPSVLEVLDFQENKREIVQMLDHHRVCFFDNLSHINRSISDLLSKVVTGAGFSRRELYSDDRDVMRQIKRVLGLNGINLAATQADLLERSIVIEMKPIDQEQRRSEEELKIKFNSLKPKILGAILTLLSKAISKMPEVDRTHLPRMTEYTIVGEAVAMALGHESGYFESVYRKNINETTEKGIQSSAVASAVLIMMTNTSQWVGTPTELYDILINIAVMNKIIPDFKYKWWPQETNQLSQQLNLVKPLLKLKGIEVVTERESSKRTITLTNKNVTDDTKNVVSSSILTPTQFSFYHPSIQPGLSPDDQGDEAEQIEDSEVNEENIIDQIQF